MRFEDLQALAAEVGASHGGAVSAPGLRLAGADRDAVRHAVTTSWQAPVRGVYLPHREQLSDVELAHVAVLHSGPDVLISGLVAARALGLRWLPEDVPGVVALIPHEARRKDAERLVLVRRCRAFEELSTDDWEGVRIAPVARVVVDACRQVLDYRKASVSPAVATAKAGWFHERCLREVRGIVLGAVADGYCTAEALRQCVDAGPIRGSALLRRACDDARRGAASPPEAELVDGLLGCGIQFACNVEVWDGEILVAVLDAYLIGTGVGAEMDSKEAHERADLLDQTLQRHDRIERHDAKLCHVTPTRYRQDPEAFHERLFAEARARMAQGRGDPPGLRLVPRGPVLRGPRVSPPPYRLPPAWGERWARKSA